MGNNKFIQDDFRGYKQSTVPKIDEALARTDPETCLLYTSPSPRDRQKSRMPSSA